MMDTNHTKGNWSINHWANGNSGVYCKKNENGITYFTGDAIREEHYNIVSKIPHDQHSIQGSFEGAHIASVIAFSHLDGGKEAKANAILIASAPELLEALQLTLNALREVIRQIPNNEGLADYNFSLAELAEGKAIELLKRFK